MGKNRMKSGHCPCGSGKNYKECCKAYHKGSKNPPTALLLMKARYAAYVKGKLDFLVDTWHPDTRPENLTIDPDIKWIGLEIRSSEGGTQTDQDGIVTFYAKYSDAQGFLNGMTEKSLFTRIDDKWHYIKGDIS